MPIDLNADNFRIESSLDVPADGFTATLSASPAFRNAADTDRVTLNAGFYDDAGNQVFITKLVEGIIDEMDLSLTPNALKVQLRGRDKMGLLLDRDIRRRYLRQSDPTAASGGTNFPNYYTVTVGTSYASPIAQQIGTDVGLTVNWLIPNYKLTTDFEAVGQAYEIIRNLAEPFNHLEPFKVDIYADGTVLFVKQRTGFTMLAEYTYAITDARILDFKIKRRVLPRFHRVTITGRGEGTSVQTHTQQQTITRSEAYSNGELVSVEETVTTTLMPEGVHLSTVSSTFDGTGLAKRETLRKYYIEGASLIADAAAIEMVDNVMNQPMEVSETIVVEERDDDGVIGVNRRVLKSTSYDSQKFVTYVASTESTLVDDVFETTAVTNESHFQCSRTMAQTVRSEYSRDPTTGQLALSQRQSSESGGFRPGGRQAPAPSSGNTPYVRDEIISTDTRAHDFSYQNDHLTKEHVDAIFAQFQQASGAVEYELQFTAIGMPWLKKGAIVQLTGLVFEDDVAYTLLPAIILSESLSYDESRGNAALVVDYRAIFWRAGT